ncbi:hypothetical protein EFP56_10345, partial [Lactobacillus helveticus]
MKSLKENWIKSIKQLNQKCSIYYCNLRIKNNNEEKGSRISVLRPFRSSKNSKNTKKQNFFEKNFSNF